MGLRHLCVVDTKNRLIGIITRKDLVNCEQELVKRRQNPREQSYSEERDSLIVNSSSSSSENELDGGLTSDRGMSDIG